MTRAVNILLTSSTCRLYSTGITSGSGTTTTIRRGPSPNSMRCKLLVVGGGTGGMGTAAKFARKLHPNEVILLEPSDKHYYQPIWTLVGAGATDFHTSYRLTRDIIPRSVNWIQEKAITFLPEQNTVVTAGDKRIQYEYLVVAAGIQADFTKVKGLVDALDTPYVGSNYTPDTVLKTFRALENFQQGNAIFTFPPTTLKCPGAPQKIAYLADAYFRKTGKRDKANIMYNTYLGVIFGVKHYANPLMKVCKQKNIDVNFFHELVEVKPDSREAIFMVGQGKDRKKVVFPYGMLHAVPHFYPVKEIKDSSLVDANGYITVNKGTLQHDKYPNIFAVGDCTNLPTSKTAAAVAGQLGVLRQNLTAAMNGQQLTAQYDGYTSCPLVTSYNTCILAEFDYDAQPLETLPIDQRKNRVTAYYLKKYGLPFVYWKMHIKGNWEGPKVIRKIAHLGIGK